MLQVGFLLRVSFHCLFLLPVLAVLTDNLLSCSSRTLTSANLLFPIYCSLPSFPLETFTNTHRRLVKRGFSFTPFPLCLIHALTVVLVCQSPIKQTELGCVKSSFNTLFFAELSGKSVGRLSQQKPAEKNGSPPAPVNVEFWVLK